MIWRKRRPEAEAFAADIETSVAIEKALAALTRDDRAKSEVEIDVLVRGDLGVERSHARSLNIFGT